MLMPTLTEYQDAIQNPKSCFNHADLQNALPEPNKIGLPRPYSGSFAVAFPMINSNSKWAVRCFSTYHQDQELRYEKISQYLNLKLPSCMVGFDFLKQGIKVKGNWYPILKMEWVEGISLNKFIEKHLNSPQEIQLLAQKFLELIHELRQCNIAHGDLQHGNILVVNGHFKLVDYDGMYVPGLAGMISNELGHRNYQHPCRTAQDYGPYIDNFSAWSIYISLLALSIEPGLRHLVNTNDDHLLLRRDDIESPDASLVLQSLEKIKDGNFQSIINLFLSIINSPDISQIPFLDLGQVHTPSIKPRKSDFLTIDNKPDLSWIADHLKIPTVQSPIPSVIERSFVKTSIISSICLYYFSLTEAMIAFKIALPLTFGVFSLLLLILNLRFKSHPEISKKNVLLSELDNLNTEVKKIESLLNKLVSDKDQSDQVKSKQEGEITVKQKDRLQRERDDIGRIDIELRKILSNISSKKQELNRSESTEKAKALEAIRTQFISSKLAHHSLTNQSIAGIGPEMTQRLWTSGIKTAADIANVKIVQHGYGRRINNMAYIEVPGRGKLHVDGIGPVKAKSLLDWKHRLEVNYQNSTPTSLPQAQENAIKSNYRAQRQSLDIQEADANKHAIQAKEATKKKYRMELDALEKQLTDTKILHEKQIKELRDRIVIENKNLTGKNYSLELQKNKIKPYSNIKFSTYLKRAIWF